MCFEVSYCFFNVLNVVVSGVEFWVKPPILWLMMLILIDVLTNSVLE